MSASRLAEASSVALAILDNNDFVNASSVVARMEPLAAQSGGT